MPRAVLLLAFLFSTCFIISQVSDSGFTSFYDAEWRLKTLQKKFDSKKEADRIEANKQFLKLWDQVLKRPESLQYPFDSLTGVSLLMPKDKSFRLITWNLPKNDGTHTYFGYIQVDNAKMEKRSKSETIEPYRVFQLSDKSAIIKNIETHVGDHTKWFGMLYYGMVECDGYYTLLGWDGNDNLIQRKFIDIFYFKSDGTPVFGKDVFKVPRKSPKRVMFEYSSEVSMSLKYNSKSGQIILNHLAPKDGSSMLDGQYQYYGPDGSYDAYEQSKDRWVLHEMVDIRNIKSEDDKTWNNPKNAGLHNSKKKDKLMPKKK
jgi:hypothetical protein